MSGLMVYAKTPQAAAASAVR
ncbi:MAG: hypothetical protein ACLT5P_06665 [Flavonifractor plautii]